MANVTSHIISNFSVTNLAATTSYPTCYSGHLVMDWLYIVNGLVAVFVAFCLLMILSGDSDILLQLMERFGKSPECLTEKVVWITGASSGIGEALAYEMARARCRLVLSARREKELERVKMECIRVGGLSQEDVLVLKLDIKEYSEHESAVQQVHKTFQKIDILINNAGRTNKGKWTSTCLAVDQELLAVNVLGPVSLTRAVLPHMMSRNEGHIVVTSSVAGKLGAALYAGSYFGSKHALQGWFDSLRPEVYSKNIAVTSVCPGPIYTNLLQDALKEKEGEILQGRMDPHKHRMSSKRCARLMAVAIANRCDEAWISTTSGLVSLYLNQYFPDTFKWFVKIFSAKLMAEIDNELNTKLESQTKNGK
ncbi:dehydrogenase/reductase SDR family member 7-like isoform X2 [Mizuhopecten yessoensis]|uniref:dehydrogenase/reductase SDR family member 7-like isoform X2 n=1 Tax=Mizuhopecten yessoensis TaxID=6573 RepID=UPI000B45969C|nr:dehydrogenase/reductase SDR family member 7-like isoform X2 [Mizuhopecten yessoensis]